MAIVGIDLGTTNSLISVWKNGKCELTPNSFGEYLTPSVVGLDDDGSMLVGKIAKERLISHPDITVSSFKRFMGTEHEINLGKHKFTPPEVSSFILKQLKQDAEVFLGEEVTEAVISVPAYFDDNGRNATKSAGELAGLVVERIINEPSAAALAYKHGNEKEGTFLIFDFGGGTLDISIVDTFENVIEIISVAGDNHLGGDDFNYCIAKYFCDHNNLEFDSLTDEVKAIIIKQSELCKIALNDSAITSMAVVINETSYTATLDNNKLVEISSSLFKRIEVPIVKALRDASISIDEIEKIILVGGSSRMLSVQKYLKHILKSNLLCEFSPDTVVAVGAGISAGIKSRNEEIKDMLLTDICPFSLGVDVVNYAKAEDPLFSPIIERNSTLPISRIETYTTARDYQKEIAIGIYQGECMYCRDNLKLSEIEMDVPSNIKGKERIDVCFTYDINGILQVDVKCLSTGLSKSKLILNKNIKMNDEQLQKRLKELEKIKILPRDKEENRLILARAESLYEENIGEIRKQIENYISKFNLILSSQNNYQIRKAQKFLTSYFDFLEGKTDYFDDCIDNYDDDFSEE